MKRLCFIGNSHLGALYKAWSQLSTKYPEVSAEFFPARKAATRQLNIVDSQGIKNALDGIAVIGDRDVAIDDFDIFIIVALGFSVVPLMELYRRYRTDDQVSSKTTQMLSVGCYETVLCGLLKSSIAMRTASLIAGMTDKPLLIVGQARPSEYILLNYESNNVAFLEAQQVGDAESLDSQYRRIAEIVVGERIAFIDQPLETLAGGLLTRGSYGVADPHDNRDISSFAVGDFWHMNVRYGRIALNKILEQLALKPTTQSKAQLLDNVLVINPQLKGVHGQARVVVYDNQKSCFVRKEIVEENQNLEIRLDALDEHLDYKYKIQSLDQHGKWIDLVPYEWVIQEQTSDDGIKYMFFPSPGSNRLVVIFQAINRKPGYNYIGTLSGLPTNRLYIKDEYGDDPSTRTSYYVGPDRSETIAVAVQKLIVEIANACDADLRRAIFCGSSKGGFAAMYHAYLAHAGYVVAGGPQVLLGNFLNSSSESSVHPPILRYLAGNNSHESVIWANELLFNKIASASEPYPQLYIHVGRDEPHYKNHVIPLIEYLASHGMTIPTIDLADYGTHEELAEHFPAYLRRTVIDLLKNGSFI